MATYDPAVIDTFASKLYEIADAIILRYTITFGLGGSVIGFLVGNAFMGNMSVALLFAIIFAVILAIIGHSIGEDKAFTYQLQAQTALCQVQIEMNTRKAKVLTQYGDQTSLTETKLDSDSFQNRTEEEVATDKKEEKDEKERVQKIKTMEDLLNDPKIKAESDLILKMYGKLAQERFLISKMNEFGIVDTAEIIP